jgi:membrane protease YdiL (CAAX protease family)
MPDESISKQRPEQNKVLAIRAHQQSVQAPGEFCTYCGAQLAPELYFCWACAAPYKSIETLITPATPVPLSEGELIRRKVPQVTTLFWSYFGTVVFSAVFAYLLFRDSRPDLQLMLQLAALLITTCFFSVRYWISLKIQLQQPGFFHYEAWLGVAALVPMLAINFGYSRFLMRVFSDQGHLPIDELRKSGISDASLIAIFCVWPALSEEIGFRGLLQHWLQIAIRAERAILLTSFLFAVMHFSIVTFPYLFGLGALLGWTKWKTGSLYPSMLIHFLHNLVVIEFF